MKLKDVFVAGGIPKLTYIPRAHLRLESRLRNGLNEGHQIIALTGPTKTGKTVLCRAVLKGRETLWIDAGQIESVDEFWGLGAEKLGIPQEIAQTSGKGLKTGINYVLVIEGEHSGQTEKRYYPSAKAAVLGTARKTVSASLLTISIISMIQIRNQSSELLSQKYLMAWRRYLLQFRTAPSTLFRMNGKWRDDLFISRSRRGKLMN